MNFFGTWSIFVETLEKLILRGSKRSRDSMNLDLIDAKILEQLQANARISLSELSKNVNLSLSAVSERLKKLEEILKMFVISRRFLKIHRYIQEVNLRKFCILFLGV